MLSELLISLTAAAECSVVGDVHRYGSRLRIESALVNDTGTYRCYAENSFSRSRPKRTRVIVRTVTASCPANSHPCLDQRYCLNDGLCCQIDMLAVKLCQWVLYVVVSVQNGPANMHLFSVWVNIRNLPVAVVGLHLFFWQGYWHQRADCFAELCALLTGLATLSPKVDPGAFSGQRQGWKTPRGPSGSARLLSV